MVELVRIAFTKVRMEALQGNTPKGVFLGIDLFLFLLGLVVSG